jgi:hypothetical protein
MNKILISKKVFTLDDQNLFARFSGDYNPIHLSYEYARMTPPGKPIVHGINSFLWCLNNLAIAKEKIASNLSVRFLQPIYLDEEISCYFYPEQNKFEISNNDIIFVRATFKKSENLNSEEKSYQKTDFNKEPNELCIEDLKHMFKSQRTFDFPFSADPNLIDDLYPNLKKVIGLSCVCEIACLSTLVGMKVPGLHSIFAILNIDLNSKDKESFVTINKVDDRFGIVELQANTKNFLSKIRALIRPEPTKVLSIDKLKSIVFSNTKLNKKVLVIGGSRGLGSVVVKILAILGADIVFTYANGIQQAINLKHEVYKINKNIKYIHFDVCKPDMNSLLKSEPEYIFYFPTPKIFVKRSNSFEQSLYQGFKYFYVDIFNDIYNESVMLGSIKNIFYPSSVAVEENSIEFPEYSLAKQDGESLCMKLNKSNKINIMIKRLPRTLTDQTATNLNIDSKDPYEVMMPIIEEFME